MVFVLSGSISCDPAVCKPLIIRLGIGWAGMLFLSRARRRQDVFFFFFCINDSEPVHITVCI